jgi:hypothetical protein
MVAALNSDLNKSKVLISFNQKTKHSQQFIENLCKKKTSNSSRKAEKFILIMEKVKSKSSKSDLNLFLNQSF